LGRGGTLTRLPPDCDPGVGTLSRGAGEGLSAFSSKLLSRTAGEEGPSPEDLVGEGNGAFQQLAIILLGGGVVRWRGHDVLDIGGYSRREIGSSANAACNR
jgi:hypothetical protein